MHNYYVLSYDMLGVV